MPVSTSTEDTTTDFVVHRYQNINGASRKQWWIYVLNLKMLSVILARNLKEPDYGWPDI